jgi:ribosomal protein L37AE/L43A
MPFIGGIGSVAKGFWGAPKAPAAIVNLVATRSASQTIQLSFTAPYDSEDPITRYEYRLKTTGSYQEWTSAGTTNTTFSVGSLANGALYTFQVRAVNSAGEASSSNESSATPYTFPGAVNGFSAVRFASQTVRLSWSAPSSNGGADITNYEYSSDNGSTWRSLGTTVSPADVTIISGAAGTALQNGQSYDFRIRARNIDTTPGTASGVSSATPYTIPSAPNATLSNDGEQTITHSWTSGGNGGNSITRWEYAYSTDNGVNWSVETPVAVGVTSATRTIQTGSTYDTNQYRLRVRAENLAGWGAWSTNDNRSTAYTQDNYTVTEYEAQQTEAHPTCPDCRSVRVTRTESCGAYGCGVCGFQSQSKDYYKDKYRTRSRTGYRTRTAYRWKKGNTVSGFIGWVDANYNPTSGYTYPAWTYTDYGAEGAEFGPSACYNVGVCNENAPGNPGNGSVSPLGNWYEVGYDDPCCNSGAWTDGVTFVWVECGTQGAEGYSCNRLVGNGGIYFGFYEPNPCAVGLCGAVVNYKIWRCTLTGALRWTDQSHWYFSCC